MIDIHSHFFPRISKAEAHAVDPERAPWVTVDADGRKGQIMVGERPFRPVHDELWDADARVRALDRAGIDRARRVEAAPDRSPGWRGPRGRTAAPA